MVVSWDVGLVQSGILKSVIPMLEVLMVIGSLAVSFLHKAFGHGFVCIIAEVRIPLEELCFCLGGSGFDVEVSIRVVNFSLV